MATSTSRRHGTPTLEHEHTEKGVPTYRHRHAPCKHAYGVRPETRERRLLDAGAGVVAALDEAARVMANEAVFTGKELTRIMHISSLRARAALLEMAKAQKAYDPPSV